MSGAWPGSNERSTEGYRREGLVERGVGEKYKLLSLFSSECEKRNGSTLTSGFRAYVEKDIIYRSVLM